MEMPTNRLDRRALLALAGATVLAPRAWAAPATPIPTAAFSHVLVACSNLKRSADFYQRLLGLTAAPDAGDDVVRLRIGPGPQTLELQQANEVIPMGHAAFGLATPGFDGAALVKRFKAMGLAVSRAGQGPLDTVSLSDPDVSPSRSARPSRRRPRPQRAPPSRRWPSIT